MLVLLADSITLLRMNLWIAWRREKIFQLTEWVTSLTFLLSFFQFFSARLGWETQKMSQFSLWLLLSRLVFKCSFRVYRAMSRFTCSGLLARREFTVNFMSRWVGDARKTVRRVDRRTGREASRERKKFFLAVNFPDDFLQPKCVHIRAVIMVFAWLGTNGECDVPANLQTDSSPRKTNDQVEKLFPVSSPGKILHESREEKLFFFQVARRNL